MMMSAAVVKFDPKPVVEISPEAPASSPRVALPPGTLTAVAAIYKAVKWGMIAFARDIKTNQSKRLR